MCCEVKTVKEFILASSEKYCDKIFCRYIADSEVKSKSYREFYEDCLAVSRYIRTVHRERIHIGFIGKTSYEYIACLTGMIFSGNTVVPFAPDITVDEASILFEDADIEILFCEEEFRNKAEEISGRCPKLKKIISLGDRKWFSDIFRKFSSDSEFSFISDIDVSPDDCALIIYTSGTTGERKGVMLSNRNLTANSSYEAYSMDDGDVSFSILPMHHVFCYACDVLKTVYDGGTLCLNGAMTDMYKNFLIFEPTVMRIVPAICKSVLTRIKITHKKNPDLTHREAAELVVGKKLRRMIAGSAFLSGKIIDEFEKYGITARQGYGMTECSPRITTSDFSDVNKYSNGKLIGVDDVRVVDGEIQVKGPSVMLGYYKKIDKTSEAFTDDGYLHTGDLGYIDGEHVYLIGRKKNLIILSNGENISPEEIENRFSDDLFIKEIIVFSENDRIIAEVYPDMELAINLTETETEKEISDIIDRVNLSLQTDRQISAFRLRKKPFPRTSTGKIKRREICFME